MPRVQWDPKITLGNVLTMVSMLGVLFAGYVNLKLEVQASTDRITQVAAQVAPVDNLETRMAIVERNQVTGRASREEADARMAVAIEELRKQNVQILQAIARLETLARQP